MTPLSWQAQISMLELSLEQICVMPVLTDHSTPRSVSLFFWVSRWLSYVSHAKHGDVVGTAASYSVSPEFKYRSGDQVLCRICRCSTQLLQAEIPGP
jgi:hypothetical protein